MPTPQETPTFPLPGSTYRGPAPGLDRLRAGRPVVRVALAGGGHAWLVTRHAEVRAGLADPRFSRAAVFAPGAPRLDGLFQAPPEMIASLDPPAHTRLRRLTEQAFSPARLAALKPFVTECVRRLLAALESRTSADLVADVAAPLSLRVICRLLGVPEADHDRFHGWVRDFAAVAGRPEDAAAARDALGGYIAALVAEKRATPGDDVLSALVAARDGDERLSEQELIVLGYTLLGAGYDSTAGHLACSVLTLLTQAPAHWAHLSRQPQRVPATVEELLRVVNLFGTDTSGLPRIATEDVPLGGVTVPAGDPVFFALTSANRDEAVFDRPERFDADRFAARTPDATPPDAAHLAFGHGVHRCLGAGLARMELTAALAGLCARFPDLRLAVPESALRWRVGEVNHQPVSLPVTWGPHGRNNA